MLEGLDRIDWERLTHAYGPAGEVPGWIRELTSDDAAVRKRAFGVLEGSICHQGSRYRASAPAVPFLFELLESPSRKGQGAAHPPADEPRHRLSGMARPARDSIRLSGSPRSRPWAGRTRSSASGHAEPEEEEDFEPGRDALWQRDAYEAVIGRIVTLQGLSRDEDPDVRAAAVKALAWFPGAAPESVRFVRDALVRETGPKERANAILSLGILARYLNDRSDVPALLACLSPDEAPSVRLSAAISLAVILGKSAPAECIDVLLEAVQSPDAPDLVGWHWLGPIAHAMRGDHRPRSPSRPRRSSPPCAGRPNW